MLRKVKWQTHDGEIKNEQIVIGNLVFFKGLWQGLLFHVMGLGFTKAERVLKFPKSKEKVTFYCLKWGITFHKKGSTYLDCLRNVVITYDEPLFLFKWMKFKRKIQLWIITLTGGFKNE